MRKASIHMLHRRFFTYFTLGVHNIFCAPSFRYYNYTIFDAYQFAMIHYILRLGILLICIYSFPFNIWGQIDSTYILPFDESFSARAHSFNKFAAFDMEHSKDESQEFTYMTNSPSSIGLGIAWKGYSLSFSRGFDFMRDKKKGKTESFEFQYHGYKRRFAYDVYIQHHKGFYNDQQNRDKTYTTYPDLSLTMYGGSGQYVFNHKKFSYKAAFNQDERQLKSAGSFLIGATLYYSKINSDSTILFADMKTTHETLQVGATLGYAYTWVISKKWFVTGSVVGGVSIGNNEPKRFFKEKIKVYPTINARFAVGYNHSRGWSLGLSAFFDRVYLSHMRFDEASANLSMNNAKIQVAFIKRFDWGKGDSVLKNTKKKLRL